MSTRPGARVEEAIQLLLEGAHVLDRDRVEVAVGRGVDDRDLLLDRQRLILRLLQDLDEPAAAIELRLRRLVESSLPNCANAASSRYCARSSRSVPATWRIALICAEPPTRDTELPTLIAGRTPWWNRSLSRKIWPSVIEMTLVGMYADRSPACVSMIGSAVSEPPPLRVVQLRRALQQARVQIEDVAGIRLAARRTAQQQRDLAIRLRVLRQVVVDAAARGGRCRGSTRPSRTPSTG